MSDEQLKEYFDFDEADLDANRNGRLSQKQLQQLLREDRSTRPAAFGCGLLSFAVAAIFLIEFISILLKKEANNLIALWAGMLFMVSVWGGMGFVILRGALVKPDLTVQQVEGRVNIVGVRLGGRSNRRVTYELHIGGYKFEIDQDLASDLMQGDNYVVYFIKYHEDQIVSLEQR